MIHRMCSAVSVVVTVLETVAARCALPALFYLCEVTEDGSVLAGVELELPADRAGAVPRREFFWSVVCHECLAAYDEAAVQVIRFLQSVYGLVVRDYNYDAAPFTCPLEPSWVGFTAEEVDILKDKSYYGGPNYRCGRCKASFWYQERVKSASAITERRVVYNNCCKGGKVFIAPFKEPPEFLRALLDFDGPVRSTAFLEKIRQYNCLFAFTSMGATIDRSMNDGGGPTIFKISGSVCHRIGSLLPEEGKTPKYAELYIYHGGDEADNRIQALNKDDRVEGGLDKAIVKGLEVMLDTHNSLVKKFRMAKQVFEENEFANVSIRIVAPGKLDGPQFNLPSTDELACLVVGELMVETPKRDIIIRGRGPELQRISSLHPAYMALQYPLLFSYGERGFKLGVKYIGIDNSDLKKRLKMTMQDFYCFCSYYKQGQHNPYLSCGLLSDQAIVDSRVCIDESRLHFILLSNDDLRAESLQGLVDTVGAGRMDGSSVDIFTTFTCNPKWPEIADALSTEPGQRPHNRADITVRVYHMKLDEYLSSIRKGEAFGKAVAFLHTVEFQKRGLPHAHILVWQDKEKRGEVTPAVIDSFISAEIPDPVEDPLGYALVAKFMMHGPCGEDNPKCPSMKDGLCSKKFPKSFQDETSVDESGFPVYRCRDNGRFVMKNKIRLDNRHVVPYNMALLKMFQAHLNVEWCNKTHVIKYLYKYVTKGPDFSKTLFERIKNAGDPDDDDYALPLKTIYAADSCGNNMISDELSQDCETLIRTSEAMRCQHNEDQKIAFESIVDKGNHMYGQIPPATSKRLKDVLEEGKVFVMRKFFYNPSKPTFRPVESPFMVQFTKYTTVEERPGLADTYPFCTYSLTSFADIPVPCARPERFIDVIGKIEMVSDVIPVQSMFQATASNTRTVILKDLLLVLWGDRALEFDAESVHSMGEKEPVIAIFVGTLPKSSHGVRGLSGSSACHWYIDEDIPDINLFRERLGTKFVPLAAYVPTGPGAIVPHVYEPPVEKTLKDLNEVDPFVDMEKNFLCTATVNRLGNDQRWWFASCSVCRKSSKHDG
ncbi:hypothetical protein ACQ4PT_060443 [Festuca glaucescens]